MLRNPLWGPYTNSLLRPSNQATVWQDHGAQLPIISLLLETKLTGLGAPRIPIAQGPPESLETPLCRLGVGRQGRQSPLCWIRCMICLCQCLTVENSFRLYSKTLATHWLQKSNCTQIVNGACKQYLKNYAGLLCKTQCVGRKFKQYHFGSHCQALTYTYSISQFHRYFGHREPMVAPFVQGQGVQLIC